MVVVAGTVAAGLLLDNVTVVPPAGAAPSSVIVPVDCWPCVTVVGASVRLTTAGGVIVRFAVRVSPRAVALSTASCDVEVAVVATCTVAEVCPLPIVTADAASCATFDVIEREISKPLFGAGAEIVIVAAAGFPPATLEGLNTTLVIEGCPP